MPRFKHVVESPYKETFRTAKVAGMFDVPVQDKITKEWDIDLPIDDIEWQIGLIVGASGSGKSTIAKELFGENLHTGFKWKASSLLDDFVKNLEATEITAALSSVGFSSPPQWLLPYSVLSTGQKFRAELARCLVENKELTVFDEYTSVVDRAVAMAGSVAFSKALRRSDKKFIAVTCHYDVEQWLQPDWVLDVSIGEFKRGCLRRPELEIKVFRCDYKAWRLFKGHHYLSGDINKSARVYIAELNGEPCAMAAVIPFPHPKLKNAWREHRTVVLPDYQGLGIGNRLTETIGEILKQEGKKLISTTSHPAMINHRMRSKKWVMTKKPKRNTMANNIGGNTTAVSRLTAAFRYVGNIDSAQKSA